MAIAALLLGGCAARARTHEAVGEVRQTTRDLETIRDVIHRLR